MFKRLVCLLLTVLMLAVCACPAALASSSDYDSNHPEKLNDTDLSASAAILIEVNSGMVVYEKNADVRMYPASTTKILTTYLALLMGNLDDVVTTSATALQLEEKYGKLIYIVCLSGPRCISNSSRGLAAPGWGNEVHSYGKKSRNRIQRHPRPYYP